MHQYNAILLPLNDTHRENCVLLDSVQGLEAGLFSTFFICFYNQLSFKHSTVIKEGRWLKNAIHQIDRT